MLKKIINFCTQDVWTLEVSKMPKFKAFWLRALRMIILTARSFVKKEIQEKASVLTYYSFLALIPILAILLGIARGFFVEEVFTSFLLEHFKLQEDVVKRMVAFAKEAMDATRQKGILGLGVVILLWSSFKLLSHLELAINHIFETIKVRSFLRRCTDYLAIILFAPLFLTLSTGITVYLSTKAATLDVPGVNFYYLINLLSYLLIGLFFTFMYLFLPTGKVTVTGALTGGLIAAILYQLVQYAYLNIQFFITQKSSGVLGALGGIPFFLIWLQLSWVIFLLGAKIAFSFQNIDAYEFIIEDFHLSETTNVVLSLLITHYIIRAFIKNHNPPTDLEISQRLSLPLILVKRVLQHLLFSHVLVEVKSGSEEDSGYLPAQEVGLLTIKKVIDMISKSGDTIPFKDSKEVDSLLDSLKKFEKLMETSDGNILLKDL